VPEADFTLSAGPTVASARTLAALGAPLTYHYDPAFLAQFRRTEQKVAQVFETENDVLILQGEAVLGLEAAVRSLVTPGMACLNLVSGIFGKGLGQRVRDAGGVVHEIEVGYDDAVDPAEVERYLATHSEIELVTVVHSETPSGTLNDVSAIGPMAHAAGALTLVDCVSSIGGMPFKTDQWHLDVCVSGPQKCLAGPSGICMVTVSDSAWERMRANPGAPRASYLSLLDWKDMWLEGGRFPFTPSISEVHGLEAAVDELADEGLEVAIDRHRAAAAACRRGVIAMGLRLWPRTEEIAAPCVTAIALPDGLSDVQVRTHARSRYGVMISGAQGAGNLVRIGHMGVTARSLFPVVGLAALGRTLADLGAPVQIGDGLAAALEVMAATSDAAIATT
jgi:pyridoxamine--pyruvate transaminase